MAHLIRRAGVPIEQKTAGAISLFETIRNQVIREGIGNVIPGIHKRLGLETQRGFMSNVVSENITRRDGRNIERGRENTGLGALTRSRRSNKKQAGACGTHLSNPS